MKCGRVNVGQLVTIDGPQTPAVVVQVSETQALVWFECDTSNVGMTQWWGFNWLLPLDSASTSRVLRLSKPDGVPVNVFMCAECKTWAHGSRALAQACCEPRTCEACGGSTDRYRTVCGPCVRARFEARTVARFEAAAKVSIDDYAGKMVFVEDDQEFVDTDELEEYLTERDEKYGPPRVYATTARRASIDAEGAIDSALDEAHEDARESIDPAAERELEEFVKAWGLEHLPLTYYEDTTTALVLWPEQAEGEPCKAVLG